jgi:hypothetical protein
MKSCVFVCAIALLGGCGTRSGLGLDDGMGDGDVTELDAKSAATSSADASSVQTDATGDDDATRSDDVASPVADAAALDGISSDGVTSSGSDDGATFASSCPDHAPKAGDVCLHGPYYCYYYASGSASCADSYKCLHTGPGPEEPGATEYGGPWPACEADATTCAEGKACGRVDAKGGCFVACERRCRCDEVTGNLRCAPLGC